jgi:hypothetical protein
MKRRAHTFAHEEQTSDRVPDPTRRVDASHLERTLLGYLEESGSDLRLTDRP